MLTWSFLGVTVAVFSLLSAPDPSVSMFSANLCVAAGNDNRQRDGTPISNIAIDTSLEMVCPVPHSAATADGALALRVALEDGSDEQEVSCRLVTHDFRTTESRPSASVSTGRLFTGIAEIKLAVATDIEQAVTLECSLPRGGVGASAILGYSIAEDWPEPEAHSTVVEANACVPEVEMQFARLPSVASPMKVWTVIGREDDTYRYEGGGNHARHLQDHALTASRPNESTERWATLPNQLSDTGERCHVQGVQRLLAGPYVAFTYNAIDRRKESTGPFDIPGNDCEENGADWGGAHLAIARLGSHGAALRGGRPFGSNLQNGVPPTADRIVADFDLNDDECPSESACYDNDDLADNGPDYWHPGGIQAVGHYLAVVFYGDQFDDAKVRLLDVSNPERPIWVRQTPVIVAGKPGAIAIVDLPPEDGRKRWLLLLQGKKVMRFFELKGDNIEAAFRNLQESSRRTGAMEWLPEVPGALLGRDSFKNYNGIGLLRECGTDNLYLIGTRSTDRRPREGNHKADLYKISGRNYSTLQFLAAKEIDCEDHCHLAAGGGVYVSPDGKLALYGAKHYLKKIDGEAFEAPDQPLEGLPGLPPMWNVKARWVWMKFAEVW